MFIVPIREKLTSMILHIPLVEDIPIVEIVPIVGHRLVCEDEQMFSSVEDVELGEVEHVAGILLDDSEVIDGHLELLLGLCNLLPLQDGGVRRPCLPPDVQAGLLTLHPLQLQLLCREGLLVDE